MGRNSRYRKTTIEEGFLDFARKLAGNEIYEAIKYADPVSQIYGYRENGSRQVHYEKMKNGPENFIAFGDSVSAFNPFYGQGITIGATILNKSLRDFRRIQIMRIFCLIICE